ncbi:MAG: prepilin-type N-terminal cleavage/methylation domain-containing protein [bacterium]
MKTPAAHRGFTLIEVIIILVIIAMLSAIVIPNYINSKRKFNANEAIKKQVLGENSELIMLSIGKHGEETFYYLVPDEKSEKVIQPISELDARPAIIAQKHHTIVVVRGEKVIGKGLSVPIEPR